MDIIDMKLDEKTTSTKKTTSLLREQGTHLVAVESTKGRREAPPQFMLPPTTSDH